MSRPGYVLTSRITVPQVSDYEIARRECERAREARKDAAFKAFMADGRMEAFRRECTAANEAYYAACRAITASRTVGGAA